MPGLCLVLSILCQVSAWALPMLPFCCWAKMARFTNCAKLRLVFSELCPVSAWALLNCARSLPGLSQIVPGLCLVLSKLCQVSAWSLPDCARSLPGLSQIVPELCLVLSGLCQIVAWSSAKKCQTLFGLFLWAPGFRLGLLFVERVLLCFSGNRAKEFWFLGFCFGVWSEFPN